VGVWKELRFSWNVWLVGVKILYNLLYKIEIISNVKIYIIAQCYWDHFAGDQHYSGAAALYK
jgi:hypothetical protein